MTGRDVGRVYIRVQDEYLRVGGLRVQLVVDRRRVPRSVQVSVVVQVRLDASRQRQRRRVSSLFAAAVDARRFAPTIRCVLGMRAFKRLNDNESFKRLRN